MFLNLKSLDNLRALEKSAICIYLGCTFNTRPGVKSQANKCTAHEALADLVTDSIDNKKVKRTITVKT